MKKTLFILLVSAWAAPLWAGTEIKALVECYAYKEAWVDLQVSISDSRLKIHFQGPWCLGAVIYDRETSQLTVVDDTRKTVFTLTRDNQAALKLIGTITPGKLIAGIAGSTASAKKTYAMVRENAQAFFNGVPFLKESGVSKAGYTCDAYQTDLEGNKAREVWITLPASAGLSGEDLNTLRSLIHLALDLCGNELAQLGADTASFQEGLSNSPLPVFADLYAGGKHTCRFQILGIHSRDFDPGVFDPPASYKTLGWMDLVK